MPDYPQALSVQQYNQYPVSQYSKGTSIYHNQQQVNGGGVDGIGRGGNRHVHSSLFTKLCGNLSFQKVCQAQKYFFNQSRSDTPSSTPLATFQMLLSSCYLTINHKCVYNGGCHNVFELLMFSSVWSRL